MRISALLIFLFFLYFLFNFSLLSLHLNFFFNKQVKFFGLKQESKKEVLVFLNFFAITVRQLRRGCTFGHKSKILTHRGYFIQSCVDLLIGRDVDLSGHFFFDHRLNLSFLEEVHLPQFEILVNYLLRIVVILKHFQGIYVAIGSFLFLQLNVVLLNHRFELALKNGL